MVVVIQLLWGGYRGGRARVRAGERAAVAQTSPSLVRHGVCEEGALPRRAPVLGDADDASSAVGFLTPEGTRPRAELCIVPAWRRRPGDPAAERQHVPRRSVTPALRADGSGRGSRRSARWPGRPRSAATGSSP